jgi:ElaB/YqjD/DUF883 family membrane-anchored ribosome-binding protein
VTRNAKRFGIIAAALLIVALAALLIAHAMDGPSPEEIKKELSEKLQALEQMPAQEILKKDQIAHELMEHKEYRAHALARYRQLEKLHTSLHESAERERNAKRDVPPFLARAKTLESRPLAELRMLYDEARSLLDSYGATSFAMALHDIRDRLTTAMEAAKKTPTSLELVTLSGAVQRNLREGRFATALGQIDAFQKRCGDEDVYRPQLEELRAAVRRAAKKKAESLLDEARAQVQNGMKAAAARALDAVLPEYKGLAEETGLAEFRRRITLP